MNREQISRLAHANHPIKSPLDDDSVRHLLEIGAPRGDERVLDLGCGGGEWLLRALSARPHLRAEGVDISEGDLREAGEAASRLGVGERLALHHQEAADFRSVHAFDLVLSVGATHAFGGLLPTLEAARKHLAPGGRVLIGDGFWEREPSPEAVEMFGDELTDLATTVDRVVADGWTPVHGHVSTRGSWTATSGPAGGRWPRGPSTTRPTRTVRRCWRPRRPAAPTGCASTGTRLASSPWSCVGPPTEQSARPG